MAEYQNLLPRSSTTNTTTNTTPQCIEGACAPPPSYISSFKELTTDGFNSSLTNSYHHVPPDVIDRNLELAIEMSREDEKRLADDLRREQEMFEEVLRLSMEEK
jgi:hypothetical protein